MRKIVTYLATISVMVLLSCQSSIAAPKDWKFIQGNDLFFGTGQGSLRIDWEKDSNAVMWYNNKINALNSNSSSNKKKINPKVVMNYKVQACTMSRYPVLPDWVDRRAWCEASLVSDAAVNLNLSADASMPLPVLPGGVMRTACWATLKMDMVTRLVQEAKDPMQIVAPKESWLVSATGEICYDIPDVGQICPISWSKTKERGVGVGIPNFYGIGVLMGGEAHNDKEKGTLSCSVGWGLLAGGVGQSNDASASIPITARGVADAWASQVHQAYHDWFTRKKKKNGRFNN